MSALHRRSAVIGALFLVAASPILSAPKDGYRISVEAAPVAAGKVKLDISTNIPGTIEVMASIELAGQRGDDLAIGTDGQTVTLHHGRGTVVLDTVQLNTHKPLPAGRYEATAAFYPQWGLKDDEARRSGIKHDIEGKQLITLKSPGESAVAAERRMMREKQVMEWVFDHAVSDAPWRPQLWRSKFGNYVLLPERFVDRNPAIIKEYYFPAIDWTVVVNVHERTMVTVQKGKGTAGR